MPKTKVILKIFQLYIFFNYKLLNYYLTLKIENIKKQKVNIKNLLSTLNRKLYEHPVATKEW